MSHHTGALHHTAQHAAIRRLSFSEQMTAVSSLCTKDESAAEQYYSECEKAGVVAVAEPVPLCHDTHAIDNTHALGSRSSSDNSNNPRHYKNVDDNEEENDYYDDRDDDDIGRPSYSSMPSKASTKVSTVRNSMASTARQHTTTIALFGAHGKTGKHFLRLALDAGYHVRALMPPPALPGNSAAHSSQKHRNSNDNLRRQSTLADIAAREDGSENHPSVAFRKVEGALDDATQIARVLRGADFCVCMMNDTLPRKKLDYPANIMVNFVRLLHSLMKRERSIKVFLYQATALAPDIQGGDVPIMAKVLKPVVQMQNPFLADQEAALQHLAREHHGREGRASTNEEEEDDCPPHFCYIVTRPTLLLLRDGPSTRKLAASRSQPGPMPVSHIDLAEFSLNALRDEKLFNTCPYVVADSF